MTESDKIQTKTKQSRLEKLSSALKQNINRRKNIFQKDRKILAEEIKDILTKASKKTRAESMLVNSEFTVTEHKPKD